MNAGQSVTQAGPAYRDKAIKRYIPFVIIFAVGIATVGTGALLYRTKMRVASAHPTTASAAQAGSKPAEGPEPDATHVRGPSNAPVTVEVYGDFQCPSCARVSGLISSFEQDYGSQLRVVYREYPLAIHPHSVEAAMAAEAAGRQGRFWEMHDMLYQYQSVWSDVTLVKPFFERYAESLGLDMEKFKADYKSEELRMQILSEGELGTSRGVQNTPTLFINNNQFQGALTRERIQAAIDAALSATKKS